jgi:hypothetical protein
MRVIRHALRWLVFVGGMASSVLGMNAGHYRLEYGPMAIAGAILAGCALIAMAIDRE